MIALRVRPAPVAWCATTLLLSVLLAGNALAQTSITSQAQQAATQQAATQPAATQQAAAQPATPPVKWQGNATVSVQLQSGVSDARTLALSAEAFRHAPHPGWSYSIQADHTHSSFKIGPDFQTVADSQNARVTAERSLSRILYFVARPAFKRNEVQLVEYRVEALAGIGARVLRTTRATMNVLGAAGVVDEDKHVPSVDGTHANVGFLEDATVAISSGWRVSQLALFLKPIDGGEDYRMQFRAALTGAIKGPLALSISYSMDRENIVFGGAEATDRSLTIGVQLNF